jgi:hypothetical protein
LVGVGHLLSDVVVSCMTTSYGIDTIKEVPGLFMLKWSWNLVGTLKVDRNSLNYSNEQCSLSFRKLMINKKINAKVIIGKKE